MPFGIHSAQVFQKKVDETYEGPEGVVAIVDDILVYGATAEGHDTNLRAVQQRFRERAVKLNPDKCVFQVTEISHFGSLLTADGLKSDPTKVAAIKKISPPTSVEELQTVLGMVNYLAKFTPQLSEITEPLKSLLKKKSYGTITMTTLSTL